MNSWCEAFEVFCSFAFFKSTQLSSDKGQEHRNADCFFILEKDVMSLSIYAETFSTMGNLTLAAFFSTGRKIKASLVHVYPE